MVAYIGANRRLGASPGHVPPIERRQEAAAGVIVGLTAEDMITLRGLWERHETTRNYNLSLAKGTT